jgi:hypothetical protein
VYAQKWQNTGMSGVFSTLDRHRVKLFSTHDDNT